MLVFLLHILISFIVLGIALLLAQILGSTNSTINRVTAKVILFGILLVGIGIYIGSNSSLHNYFYITLVLLLILLFVLTLIYRRFKKVGNTTIINISSIFLVAISYLVYIYYIVSSFMY